MGSGYHEEKQKLHIIIKNIEKAIHNLILSKPYPDIGLYSTARDYSDLANLHFMKKQNMENVNKAEQLKIYLPSPYFARMDFRIAEGDSSIYIGKKGLEVESERLIYDWRSQVGQCYYSKKETTFSYNDYLHELTLRRSINIKNGHLINIHDEYVQGDDLFAQDIYDPFLLDVLREKREERQLTDIIRTIQQNQHDIIQADDKKEFIVQGCAGSGKTMILLHRLSYLKFNNRNMDLSRVKILTPSKNFNLHISHLTRELELDEIDQLTSSEYYLSLLRKYEPDKWGNKRINENVVGSEEFLTEIYSYRFLNKCILSYKRVIEKIEREIRLKKLVDICTRKNIEHASLVGSSDIRKIEQYYSFVSTIIRYNNGNNKNLVEYQKKMKRLREKKMVIKAELNRTNSFVNDSLKNSYEIQRGLDLLAEKNNEIYKKKDELSEEIVLDYIKDDRLKLQKLKKSLSRNVLIKKDMSFIKFRKTTEINREISILELNIEHEKSVAVKKRKLIYLTLKKLWEDSSDNFDKSFKLKEKYRKQLYKIRSDINNMGKEIVSLEEHLTDASTIKENYDTNLEKSIKLLYEMEENIEYEERCMVEISELILIPDDIRKFEEAKDKLENCGLKQIFDLSILKELEVLEKKFDLKVKKQTISSYHPYVYLIFYSLYMGKIVNSDLLINIDEGQDLSKCEYDLIKKVNGERIVFNIYGDVNQLVNQKGIMNWKNALPNAQIFELNENYRNSTQITDYCNENLSFDALSIGTSGVEVKNISSKRCFELIEQDMNKNQDIRISVIINNDNINYMNFLEMGLQLNRVVSGQISLFEVRQVKGIEFDKVYVFADYLGRNEKYIAFTRALGELIIVND